MGQNLSPNPVQLTASVTKLYEELCRSGLLSSQVYVCGPSAGVDGLLGL